MRVAYEHQLQELSDIVVTMASMVDKAIARAVESLRNQDLALAADVRRADNEINALQRRGEEMAVLLIATQGPMAGDVRHIASAMSILSNLERMGDYASGIAKIVIEMRAEAPLKPLISLPLMAQISRGMLTEAVTAYIEHDADAARQIAVRDDQVDDLYDDIFQELVGFMQRDPTTIPRATRLLWVAHNIERIADRVTNICERVVYTKTGEFEELDGGRRERQSLIYLDPSNKGGFQ
ncbi:MAG TPA: phosphate signaling complex protein PhoU [Thermomicrobiales bacterium]|nr:phosphate signaling complex protein PhoU [Thermomicrobiales bacterium]